MTGTPHSPLICHCTHVDGRVYPDPNHPCPNNHHRGDPAPAVIEYTDELVEAVCNAWTVPGPHYAYHREMQRRLERDWPVLADAITALVAGTTPQKDS